MRPSWTRPSSWYPSCWAIATCRITQEVYGVVDVEHLRTAVEVLRKK
jgi:hypothetical protein